MRGKLYATIPPHVNRVIVILEYNYIHLHRETVLRRATNKDYFISYHDRIYKALVEPVMYYGSAIWGTLNCAKLDAVQARACKFFLGIRKNTSNIAAR